jgi:hypothetical protein
MARQRDHTGIDRDTDMRMIDARLPLKFGDHIMLEFAVGPGHHLSPAGPTLRIVQSTELQPYLSLGLSGSPIRNFP